MLKSARRITVLLTLMTMLPGCSAVPQHYSDLKVSLAARSDVAVTTMRGGGFDLLAIESRAVGRHATIFIEGDGRPWQLGGNEVSTDPTPREPYLLPQMLEREGFSPSLYLGRPCYFGLGPSSVCDANVWTFSRYSDDVVDAMLEATEAWLSTLPQIESVALVGHSGGGVLVLLIAERISLLDQVRVVALATPVSTEKWTNLHGYLTLDGSLDPSLEGRWRAGVERLFVFGERDRNVPPGLFVPVANTIPNSHVLVVEGEGHRCCSPDIWGSDKERQ